MTRLSVNINKIATLRNARGGSVPNVLQVALDCEAWGAQGITVHPRPDERHIRYQDVLDLAPRLTTEFNIEGYPDERYMELVSKVKPAQATLVPDGPHVLTSNAGWDTLTHKSFLTDVVKELKSHGVRVSIFTGTEREIVEGAAAIGADRVELYTEPYAARYAMDRVAAVTPFVEAAKVAHAAGLKLNAGHDLSLQNLAWFVEQVPYLDEVSIGHALIADALYFGLENTVNMYLQQIRIGAGAVKLHGPGLSS